ncbi:MAG: glutamate-5-semialdehyde dehydrogenase [Anaerolineae bacterium]
MSEIATAPTTLDLINLGRTARAASRQLAHANTTQKAVALHAIAEALLKYQDEILEANQADLAVGRSNDLSEALLDRLSLQGSRLFSIAADTHAVAELPDPIGEVFDQSVLPNGLRLEKRRVPLGVLGVIYEARPNVTVDVAALALKTGNAAILRGGKETIHSNRTLIAAIHEGLAVAHLPQDAIQFIDSPDRQYVYGLLRLDQYVDMIIPRGGAGLHEFCRQNSLIPVMTGGVGICHIYVDASAKQDQSLNVIYNAKTQRPSVCNALDTVLVNAAIAQEFIPRLVTHLKQGGVTFKMDEQALSIIGSDEACQLAGEGAWDTEWMSLTLGVRVVGNLDEALAHIQAHSTQHSDGILTETPEHAERFLMEVDSAAVYVNASTRFTDGGQFGLGAEVAVSTQKLHARGPMGLKELTTYKWIGRGDYHVRV